ncbi:GNAT family N-acetyltransferase [Pseudoxanthobacter sp. M-2]|uniref:GNAT family N-acetyltransferase n=1 Tax=Pseudoxanthobacter sp. M-2 TaxID=3078754 RepID=UPI0038FCB4B5
MDGASAVDVLRLETANLSAWPAERLHHDGTWLLRRTPGHGSKRLNSLNFLDPADDRDAEARLAAMAAASRRHGLDPTVRITPLTPPSVVALVERDGFEAFDETLMMVLPTDGAAMPAGIEAWDAAPRRRWAEAMKTTASAKAADIGALVAVLERIVPEAALMVAVDGGTVAASTLAVRDRDLVGLFDVGTNPAFRRRGHASACVRAALAWGRAGGARTGYLQVLAGNTVAVDLYRRMGFTEAYRGDYRRTRGSAA